MNSLRRYWFTFPRSSRPTPLNLGSGVTAYDYDDAMDMLRQRVFNGAEPSVADVIVDVDVSTLDKATFCPTWVPQL
jgi:hypothetical protein